MKKICERSFDEERSLYGVKDIVLENCRFDGPKDGESALKEVSGFKLVNCYLNLRYPLWHSNNFSIVSSMMTEGCRAAIWYSNDIIIKSSKMNGIKALRECNHAVITDTTIDSQEFGWKSKNIFLEKSSVTSEYAFLECENLRLNNVLFKGKYSFQYVKNLEIDDSNLDTKDAFWHADNVVVRNSVVKGEYLGWYSTNLTFINCKIIGTQPLCYCKGLKLIDCEMIDTDLAFEYSEVNATIVGNILSVKNPTEGYIRANLIDEIILENSKYPLNCKIEVNK